MQCSVENMNCYDYNHAFASKYGFYFKSSKKGWCVIIKETKPSKIVWNKVLSKYSASPVGWSCNCEASVILEFCWMQSSPSLSLLPGPLWPRVVAPDKVLYMSQIELWPLNCVLMLNWIVWNRTVWSFNCV